MKLFGGVSGRKIDSFAKSLADRVAKSYPPEMEKGDETKISEKRITRILEDVFEEAMQYRDEHKLGVYKKARLSNTFKWELDELGFSKSFVEVATEGMVVYLSRRRPKRPRSPAQNS